MDASALLPFLALRQFGYSLLSGKGIEIGPFEHPAKLPAECKVEYCDAITPEQAKVFFPELAEVSLPEIHHLLDLNKDGLKKFPDDSFDFVICNHVIEHVVNPVFIVGELLRIIKKGGCLVIAAPDKDYTFDKDRPLTPWEHNLQDFETNQTESTLEDYMEIVTYIHPHVLKEPPENLPLHLQRLKERREHLHVWNSKSFREFLQRSFSLQKLSALPIYEVDGNTNHFEYFGVWVKGGEAERQKYEKALERSRKPGITSWIVDRVQHHYRTGGIAGILKAIKDKSAKIAKMGDWRVQ